MDSNRQELERTLSRIENIGLPHPSSAILSSFVSDALNPISAARYVNARLSIHPASSLVSDWTYIVRCRAFRPQRLLFLQLIPRQLSGQTAGVRPRQTPPLSVLLPDEMGQDVA